MTSHIELTEAVLADALSWFSGHGFELTNREWANLIWLCVGLVFAVSKLQVRASLRDFLRSAFAPKVVFVWIIYAAWIVTFVALAHWGGVWTAVLTKDTIVWIVTAGLALLMGFTEASSKPGYFRRAILKVVSAVAILEYLITLASFPLLVELLLQPVVFLFAIAPIVVREPKQRTSWQCTSTRFFAIFGFVLLAHTTRTLLVSWETINLRLLVLRALWPMALAFWVLMLVFALAVVASYEQAFLRLNWSRGGEVSSWRGKLALLFGLGLRLNLIHEAVKGGTFHVAHANSVRDALGATRRFKTERIAEKRREDAYQADLVRYAGSGELDEYGRPRDKREFRETVRALEWLHTCQIGWYRREPEGYKPDLIERFGDDFTTQGLPIPSGIIMTVAEDRKRWFAWRRTSGGHYFAIGASEPPPNQWLYDGPGPPRDFPGIGVEWGQAQYPRDHARNWYE